VYGRILTLKTGGDDASAAEVEESIAIASKFEHPSTLSWSYQTLALLLGLRGDLAKCHEALAKSSSLAMPPFQQLRGEIIRLTFDRSAQESTSQLIELRERAVTGEWGSLRLLAEVVLDARGSEAPGELGMGNEMAAAVDWAAIRRSGFWQVLSAQRS
jgi:hypothetical protein